VIARLALLLAAAGVARADIVVVYVFAHDFSVNAPPGPVIDPTINVGDTVRWVFLDSGHSTTSVSGIPEQWDSGFVGIVGEVYERTFTHAGVWWYYCFPHGHDLGNGTAAGMAGTVTVHPVCYPNCDSSTTPPILNIQDFACFLNEFAAGAARANCDASTTPPVLNVQDFACFLNAFAAGCS
jgi:hypothetical protein